MPILKKSGNLLNVPRIPLKQRHQTNKVDMPLNEETKPTKLIQYFILNYTGFIESSNVKQHPRKMKKKKENSF